MILIVKNTDMPSSAKQREQLLYDKAMDNFDFITFSRLSLGRKFKAFSPEQKREFTHYFSKLISRSYAARLDGQDVKSLKVEYDETFPLKPKKNILRADVATRLINSGTIVPVIYRMIKRGEEHWKIYDVKIEGVSMAANYRDQFRQSFSDSPGKIITDLKGKLEDE